jgi:hypothetical protein
MGATYQECVNCSDVPVSPGTVLQLARAWHSVSPEQVLSWENAAQEESERRASPWRASARQLFHWRHSRFLEPAGFIEKFTSMALL